MSYDPLKSAEKKRPITDTVEEELISLLLRLPQRLFSFWLFNRWLSLSLKSLEKSIFKFQKGLGLLRGGVAGWRLWWRKGLNNQRGLEYRQKRAFNHFFEAFRSEMIHHYFFGIVHLEIFGLIKIWDEYWPSPKKWSRVYVRIWNNFPTDNQSVGQI